MESDRPDIRKTNVTLDRRDVRTLKRLMLDWEDEHGFLIELKESHCLNAAVQLIIRASSPKLINAYADKEEMKEDDRKALERSYEWFRGQYIQILKEVIDTRIEEDKRRINKTAK